MRPLNDGFMRPIMHYPLPKTSFQSNWGFAKPWLAHEPSSMVVLKQQKKIEESRRRIGYIVNKQEWKEELTW